MAKKKTENKEEKKVITSIDNALEITKIINEVKRQKNIILEITQRIDRLVAAINKSKKVKGI